MLVEEVVPGDDRNRRVTMAVKRPEMSEESESIEERHPKIQNDGVRAAQLCDDQPLLGFGRRPHVVALEPEHPRKRIQDGLVVLHEEDGCRLPLRASISAVVRRRIGRYDRFMLGLALTGIPLWIITKTPVWSVILVCVIDSSGYFLTARKVWRKPRRETPFSYLFSCGGAFLSLLAIANYTPSTWLYPAFLTCSNLTMASYILLRRALTHPRRLRAKKRKTRALASGFPESSELSSLHW